MNIDALFISSLLRTESQVAGKILRQVPLTRVKGEERELYKFIRDYYKKNKSLPSGLAIKRENPFYKIEKSEDPVEYFVEQLTNRTERNILSRGFENIYEALNSGDTVLAKEKLRDISIKLGKVATSENDSVKQSFAERKEEYYKFKELDGKIGYQTGIPSIDRHLGGLADEMVIIMAKRGVGKTFLLIQFVKNMWRQVEKPIVVITNEISKKKISKRVDSAMARINYSKYRKGLLSPRQERRFERLGKVYSKLPELLIIPGAGRSVEEITYELIAIDPAIVFCDGIYLSNQGKRDVFANTLDASRQYQMYIAKHERPGIFTTQMNKEDMTKYAGALEEDADIIIKMFQTPRMFDDKVMGLEFTKIREEAPNLKVYLNWDFDNWNFSEREGGMYEEANKEYETDIS